MKLPHLLTICLLLTACATPQSKTPMPAEGFLSDYTRLNPGASDNSSFRSYVAPKAIGRNVGRLYINPVLVYTEKTIPSYLDSATLTEFSSKFKASLAALIDEKKFTRVTAPEQADTIVDMAITEITAVEPDRKIIDYIPLRLLTKPIKDAALGRQQEVAMTLEMKMRDAATGQTIFESMESAKGKTIGRTGDSSLHADLDTLEPVIDVWTHKIAEVIASFQSGDAKGS